MPELPDIEVFRRYIGSTALHQRIKTVEIQAPARMRDVPVRTLKRHLIGAQLKDTDRHGKFLFVALKKNDWLVLHFGMTGFLRYFKQGDPPQHTLLLLALGNGYRLAYAAPRKLGRIALTDDPASFAEAHDLGVDALRVAQAQFRRLGKGRGGIKSWLMNQRILAGIGNEYSDEILFQAKIDPRSRRENLAEHHWRTLYRQMRKVLKAAIAAQVEPERMPRNFLLPHRREGEGCPRCGGKVRNRSVSGRSSFFCPRCQQRL